MLKKPIQIGGWQAGIGSSPYTGFESVFNADIYTLDGAVKPNFKLFQGSDTPVNNGSGLSFTGTTGTNLITVSGGTFRRSIGGGVQVATGRAIQVSGGSLPSGLSASTTYFIINDTSSTTFQLSATLGGSAISIGNGSGTITSIDPAEINYFAYNKDLNTVYGQDINGQVWQYTGGVWEIFQGVDGSFVTQTNAMGNGLIVWNNYLMAFRQQAIDCCGPLNGSAVWTTLTGVSLKAPTNFFVDHAPFVSTDTNLYFADLSVNGSGSNYTQAYLEGLVQVTGQTFAPGTAGTFIAHVSNPAPFLGGPGQFEPGEVITCLEQLGSSLQIATNKNHIYPWDRSSTTYNIPLWTAENYVHSMVNINNVLYFSAGNKGNIYKTYGTYAVLILDFSDYVSGFPQYTIFETQITKYQSRLLFAISQANPNATGSAITTADQVSGVYSLNLGAGTTSALGVSTDAGYCMEFQTSGGLGVSIPDILVASDWGSTTGKDLDIEFNIFVSWKTVGASTVGIDCLQNGPESVGPFRATAGLCQITSQISQIGTANEPQTPERFLISLNKPLASGESVTIQFRSNDTVGGTWSTGTTFTGTATASAPTISTASGEALGGGVGLRDNVNLENCIWLQVLVTLNAASGATFACPEVQNVEVY
jgi:hypothetical protein